MLIRIVRLPLDPVRVPEFLEIFAQSAVQIRQQPGCQHLELWQDADAPHIYCTYSHWDDAEALNTYRHSALFGQVWPATKRLLTKPAEAFSVVRAAPGASNVIQ
jgi:quinol monooxygenase YgiN